MKIFLGKKLLPVSIVGVAIVIVILLVATKPQRPKAQISERIWRVETVKINPETLSPITTLYGKIESPDVVQIASPGQGQVSFVQVREGDQVLQGQPLLKLDERDFMPALKQAQAKVEELKAQIENERIQHEHNVKTLALEKKVLTLDRRAFERAETVKEKKLGSISSVDVAAQQVERQQLLVESRQLTVNTFETRLLQIEARLKQAEADLEQKRLAWERSQIHAPYDAIIAQVNVAEGDRVNINETLLSLYAVDKLEIRSKIPIPLQDEIYLALGEEERITGLALDGKNTFPVYLARLSGQSSPSGTDAIFHFDSPHTSLRIGTVVVIRLQRPEQDNLVPVPYQALYGQERIYRIVNDRLEAVRVEVVGEYKNGDDELPLMLIRSDQLRPGDRVSITHFLNAYNGLKVTEHTN